MQIGPYTVERELGRGGMGAVYLARRSPQAEPVAIKVIHADLSLDEDLAVRFAREGAALERLSHPNLVALRGQGVYRGGHWLAMDYVAGSSLAERLKTQGPWPSHAARELMISLCAGIEHAHQAGILHRDLKPDNVLLRAQDGQALIADFGLALPLDVSQHLTRTGEILGSPGYLAPEQCGLELPTTPATDVYGLGALLYAVLTGQPPISGTSLLSMLDNVLNAPPRPPGELVENLDPGLEEICLRCLAKDPSERYPGVAELRAALEEETPVAAPTSRAGLWLALAGSVALGAALFGTQVGDAPASPSQGALPSPTGSAATPVTASPPAPAPTGSSTPNPSASPGGSIRAAEVEAALAERNWERARALSTKFTGPEGHWLRYRTLEAELSWTGTESEAWRSLKREAIARLKTSTPTEEQALRWSRGLRVAIYLLGDRRLQPVEIRDPPATLRLLEAAIPAAESQQRLAALRRAIVAVQLRFASPSATLASIARWEDAGGVTWQTQLQRAAVAMKSKQGPVYLRAIRAGELATYEAGHPWARFEFYRLRLPPRVRPSQTHARLCEAILTSQAPASFKATAALELAENMVRTRAKPARAAELLERHRPQRELPLRIRGAAWQSRAIAELDSGRPRAVLALLGDPGWLSGPNLRYRDQLLRACAHAILGEEEVATRVLAGVQPPPGRDSVLLFLELRLWLLLARRERTLAVTEEIVSQGDVELLLSTIRILESLLKLKAPQGGTPPISDPRLAREVARSVIGALKPERFPTAERLIGEGRWEAAVELLARLHDPADPPKQDAQTLQTCYQALRRGLEDLPPSAPRWRAALRYAQTFVERGSCEKPKEILSALLESLEEVSPARRGELSEVMERAARQAPLWEEFAEAAARLRRRSLLDQDARTRHRRHAEALRALRYWSETFPASEEAEYELLTQAQGSDEQFAALEARVSEFSALGVRIRLARRARWHATGRLSPEDFLLACTGLTSGAVNPLPRDRRKTLLLITEALGPETPRLALEVQRLLDSCDALTRPPQPSADPVDAFLRARYLSLRARNALARGRVAEALALTKGFEPYSTLLSPQAKAYSEVLRGRIELRAGRSGGLERIKRATAATPLREGFLALARASQGDARAQAYERALAFPAKLPEIDAVLTEIQAAGLDPLPMVERKMLVLEALDGCHPLAFGATLFSRRRDQATALLLWEALRVEELRNPPQAELFRKAEGALLEEALQALPSATRALIQAQNALEDALDAQDEERIRDGFERLRALPRPVEVSDRLRIPVSLASALLVLEGPDEGEENPGELIVDELVAREKAPLRVVFWIAERYRRRGDLERAKKLSARDLSKTRRELKACYLFQRALDASAAGDDPRALELLGETLALTNSTFYVASASLSEAAIRLRRGELREAEAALRTGGAFCGPESPSLRAHLGLQECRLLLLQGRPARARSLFGKLGQTSDLVPEVRSLGKAVEAAILNAEGRHQEALAASEAAFGQRRREVLAHISQLSALVGLERRDEALAKAEALLSGSLLAPGPKAQIRAWLEEQRER